MALLSVAQKYGKSGLCSDIFYPVSVWYRYISCTMAPRGNKPVDKAVSRDSGIQLKISSTDALVDDIIKIRSEGHEPGEEITIRTETAFGKGPAYFHSYGHFKANPDGVVDLRTVPSLSGTYKGVHVMGLFWSQEPIPGQRTVRMLQRDSRIPFITNVEVYKGFRDFNFPLSDVHEKIKSYDLLYQSRLERRYLSDKVERCEVRHGRLRGALFVPKEGRPKTAGIIDVFGGAGGIAEFRAALLASHGFVTYALPYFSYDDLPRYITDVEAEYFEEAVDFMNSHPRVKAGAIGMVGTCHGGQMTLLTASSKPELKAVVGVSAPHCLVGTPILIKGKASGFSPTNLEKCSILPNNAISTANGFDVYLDKDLLLPVENINAHVLLIAGGDDQNLPSSIMGNQMKARLEDIGKGHLIDVITYPGAGHLIEPPFMPLTVESFVQVSPIMLFWGGKKEEHAFAQEDSWKRIIAFFNDKLLK